MEAVILRLKLKLSCSQLRLPRSYQSILQGFIYHIFNQKKYGNFLHDEGYRLNEKVFKLFTFSNLIGPYRLEDNSIIYDKEVYFHIASHSEEFMQYVYQFLLTNKKIILNHQVLMLQNIELIDPPYIKGVQEIRLKTISPIVAYKTKEQYVHYFKPSDPEFEELCLTNLEEKNLVINQTIQNIFFSINKVNYEKKRIIRFKNTFYVAYLTEMIVSTNYETLNLIYNTGLSAKGSAGFGMLEVRL